MPKIFSRLAILVNTLFGSVPFYVGAKKKQQEGRENKGNIRKRDS
jgi:hypothetical protein